MVAGANARSRANATAAAVNAGQFEDWRGEAVTTSPVGLTCSMTVADVTVPVHDSGGVIAKAMGTYKLQRSRETPKNRP